MWCQRGEQSSRLGLAPKERNDSDERLFHLSRTIIWTSISRVDHVAAITSSSSRHDGEVFLRVSEEVISRQNRSPDCQFDVVYARVFEADHRPGQELTPASSSTLISRREHSRDSRGKPRILTAHDNKHGRRGVVRVHSQLHGRGIPAVLRRPRRH